MNLASLMLLMVLGVGILGLFSVWSLNTYQARTQAALSEVNTSMDQARRAQLHFKTQIQEWKNILLRGHVMSDRAVFVAAFEKEKAITSKLLEGLLPKVGQIQKSEALIKLLQVPHSEEFKGVSPQISGDIQQAITSLAVLNQTYEQALHEAQKDGLWDPRAADSMARGADRNVIAAMEEVPVEFERAYGDLMSLANLASASRFETLTSVVWTGVIFALSMVAFMLWRMLKHPALVK